MDMTDVLKVEDTGKDEDETERVKGILQMVKTQFVEGVTASSTTGRETTKDILAEKLSNVLNIVNWQNQYIIQLERQNQKLSSKVEVTEGIVTYLQGELTAAKEHQHIRHIKHIQHIDMNTAGIRSVEGTVKSELNSDREDSQDSRNQLGGFLSDLSMT